MMQGLYARKVDMGGSKEDMRRLLAEHADAPVTVIPPAVEMRQDMCQSKWVNIGGNQIARTETPLARTLRILEEIKNGGKDED